jgi:hypothetical protein
MHIQERTFSILTLAALAVAVAVPTVILLVRGLQALKFVW